MSRGVQKYRPNEVKRAVRALQEAGIKIASVAFEGGRFEVVTAEDEPKAGGETSEDVKKLL